MKVIGNPYHSLDHKSRLAGACPEPEPVRRGGAQQPLRRYVGATRKMAEGSFVESAGYAFKDGPHGRGDIYWEFSAVPIEVYAEGHLEHFYLHRFRHEELFSVEDDVPIEKLARARMKAFAEYQLAYGKDPDTSTWAEQFKIDDQVRDAVQKIVEAEKKAAADAAVASAKVKAEADVATKVKAGVPALVTETQKGA